HLQESRLTGRIEDAMPIGMNHHIDEIRIVERGCCAVKRLICEVPRRRPRLPQKPTQGAPIHLKPGPSAFRIEVILIPNAALCSRRRWREWGNSVLNAIAANEHSGPHAILVKRCRDASSSSAPVESGHSESFQLQGIGKIDDILPDRRLLR